MKTSLTKTNLKAGVVLLLCAACFNSCKKDSKTPGQKVIDKPAVADVYVCGYEYDPAQTHAYAEVWKNGTVSKLTDGDINSVALAITIVGNDVYIAGYIADKTHPNAIAAYWKNGTRVDLTNGKYEATTSSIFVDGDNVYVCGYERDSNSKAIAKYWKNGTAVSLAHSYATTDAVTTGITVIGGDVYVAGTITGKITTVALYWKNGKETDLDDGSTSAYTHSIFVDGDKNVYIPGDISTNNSSEVSTAGYWKNGTFVKLTDGADFADIYALNVIGNDVYAAGATQSTVSGANSYAKYWKNGSAINITDGKVPAALQAITIKGTDIYTAGYKANSADLIVPAYWKNGTPVNLPSGTGTGYGLATGIAVK